MKERLDRDSDIWNMPDSVKEGILILREQVDKLEYLLQTN
jgi:hypothetical protein